MIIHYSSICLAVAITMSLLMQGPSAQCRAENQDMSKQDIVGPVELGFSADRSRKEAEVRSFIWFHWLGRSRGKITVVDYTKEGDKITTTYDVEPDEIGRWRVRANSEADFRKHPGTPAHRARKTYSVYALRRVAGDSGLRRTLADSDNVPSTMYRLALIDAKGKQVGEL